MDGYRLPPLPAVDPEAIGERAAALGERAGAWLGRRAALDAVVASLDLTSLEATDTPERIDALCRRARRPDPEGDVPPVAAVCVFPTLVAAARRALGGSGVRVAAVAGAFPSGQSFLATRLDEVRRTVDAGADEVDVVMNRAAFLAGDHGTVHDELVAIREACASAVLKVILETGELGDLERVRQAARLALDAGADFIKTSTGKIPQGATPPAALVMLDAIGEVFKETRRPAGLKVAGGVRTAAQALHYLGMTRETLGEEWLTPERFRLGASSLLDDVLAARRRTD